jgi:hypothetical protein
VLNMQDEARQGSSDVLPYASWIHAGADRDTTGSETRTPEAPANGIVPRVAAAALVKTRQRRVKSVGIMHLFRTCVQITGIPEQQAAKGNATCIARPMEDRNAWSVRCCPYVQAVHRLAYNLYRNARLMSMHTCSTSSGAVSSRGTACKHAWPLRTRIPVDLARRV